MMDSIDDMIAEGSNADEMARRKNSDQQDVGDEYVDRIEGDTAVLLKNAPGGPTERNVPLSSLPGGTKEGDMVPAASLYGQEAQTDDAAIINSLYGASFR